MGRRFLSLGTLQNDSSDGNEKARGFLWDKGHAQLSFSQIRRSSSSSLRLDFSSFGAATQREKNGRFLRQNEGKILNYLEGINAGAYSWQDLIIYQAFYSLAKFQGHFGWNQIFRAKLDRGQGLWPGLAYEYNKTGLLCCFVERLQVGIPS